jgi:predicted metal-dependent peptidase
MTAKPAAPTKAAEEKVKLAVAGLFNRAIFDASILASMRLEESTRIPTMATDCMTVVKYNKAFVDRLQKVGSVMTALAHEARHKAFMHGLRRGDRDPLLSNLAQDFVINRTLLEDKHDFSEWQHATVQNMCDWLAGKHTLQPGSICLDAYLGIDQSWEDIYDLLDAARKKNPANQQQGGQDQRPDDSQSSDGSGGSGQSKDGDEDEQGDGEGARPDPSSSDDASSGRSKSLDGTKGSAPDMLGDVDGDAFKDALKAEGMTEEEAERELTAQVLQAAQASKAIGQEPGLVKRIIEKYGTPQVNWASQLRRFVVGKYGPAVLAGDWSYRRPSRRFDASKIIMPSLVKQPSSPLVVIVDTSGSISERELALFGAEINSIVKTVRPSVTHVLWVDTRVNAHQKFAPDDKIVFTPGGGGGTDLEVAWAYIEKEKIKPCCAVVLTDMMTGFTTGPKYPVLWVATTDVTAPYGETIRIKV